MPAWWLPIEPSVRDERAGVASCAVMVLADVLSARAVNELLGGR